MGDCDGEGMEILWEPVALDGGVGRSELEPDEAEETETERDLPRGPMGMGLER